MSEASFSAFDRECMGRALQLAQQGLWSTAPNPRVGCVIAQDDLIIGEGWHERAGEPHAEVHALAAAGEAARGATAYVTLEPCSHTGRTPPCAEALVAAGVARVVAATEDPNPLVAGRGFARLRAAGITVESGLLAEAAEALNVGFFSRMRRGRPWVRLKVAMSLDGRTALANGQSQWITGEAARQDGHRWRAQACAILTGIGTVLADDPQLNVRGMATQRQPRKVVIDRELQLPVTARLLDGAPVLVATAAGSPVKADVLRARGAEVLDLPGADGKVDLPGLLLQLGQRGINELHVEGGAGLNGALLAAGLVDELLIYLAPCLLGDTGLAMARLPVLTDLAGRIRLTPGEWKRLGDDWRWLTRVVPTKT